MWGGVSCSSPCVTNLNNIITTIKYKDLTSIQYAFVVALLLAINNVNIPPGAYRIFPLKRTIEKYEYNRTTTAGGAPIAQNNNWGIQAAYLSPSPGDIIFWIVLFRRFTPATCFDHSRQIFDSFLIINPSIF